MHSWFVFKEEGFLGGCLSHHFSCKERYFRNAWNSLFSTGFLTWRTSHFLAKSQNIFGSYWIEKKTIDSPKQCKTTKKKTFLKNAETEQIFLIWTSFLLFGPRVQQHCWRSKKDKKCLKSINDQTFCKLYVDKQQSCLSRRSNRSFNHLKEGRWIFMLKMNLCHDF